jgi:hypothetical protein
MRSRFLILVLAVVTAAGCTRGISDEPNLPTAPTPQAPRPLRLTITPTGGGALFAGTTVSLTTSGSIPPDASALGAFVQFNDGQAGYVEAQWTSSDDTVLAVIDNTLVARRPGNVTLTAAFEGQNDTEEFVVDAGFVGRWAGRYVVDHCSANSGSMHDVLCRPPANGRSGIAPVGGTLPFTMEISEAGGDDITARVSFGSTSGILPGKNLGSGYFELSGTVAGPAGSIKIVDWNMRGARDAIIGFLSYEIRLNGLPGAGSVAGRVVTMTRQ